MNLTVIENSPPARLRPRTPDSHKGTYGRVLAIAGSCGMSGAAILCGTGALRGGSGLVKVATPKELQALVAAGNPCYMTAPIPHHANGTYSQTSIDVVLRLAEQADVIAVGPGIGTGPDVAELVRALIAARPNQPIVLDADGITVFAPVPAFVASRSVPLVITPHPGEFSRLTGKTVAEVQANRERCASEFGLAHNMIVLLKGHASIVTDGRRLYRNTTGNPGLAKGGTGDVLTGLMRRIDKSKTAISIHDLETFKAFVES